MASAAIRDPFAKPTLAVPKIQTGSKPLKTVATPQPNTGAQRVAGGPIADTGGPAKIISAKAAAGGVAPVATAPAAVAPAAAAPTAPDTSAQAIAGVAPPGLTPDQTTAFNTAWNNYQGSLINDQASLTAAPINEAAQEANNNQIHDANTAAEQENAASRGVFTSSIKDGALDDIDKTRGVNNYAAQQALIGLVGTLNGSIKTLTDNWGATAAGAVGDSVINAANVTPDVPPAAPSVAAGTAPANYYNGGQAGAGAGKSYINQVVKDPSDWRPSGGVSNIPASDPLQQATPIMGSVGAAAGNKAVAKSKSKGK